MHVIAVDASSLHVCIDKMVSNDQYALPPQSSPQKAKVVSPSYAQSKAQINYPQRISWLLVTVSNVTHIALRARMAEERKKEEDEQ